MIPPTLRSSLVAATALAVLACAPGSAGTEPEDPDCTPAGEDILARYEGFVVVYREELGFLALAPNGTPLFTVYPFDNGPDYPSEGLLRIVADGRIGFADEQGNTVIEPRFAAVRPFHGGLAAYCQGCSLVAEGEHAAWRGGTWGFVGVRGDTAIPARYDAVVEDFHGGFASVRSGSNVLRIDVRGEPVLPPIRRRGRRP